MDGNVYSVCSAVYIAIFQRADALYKQSYLLTIILWHPLLGNNNWTCINTTAVPGNKLSLQQENSKQIYLLIREMKAENDLLSVHFNAVCEGTTFLNCLQGLPPEVAFLRR